VVAGLEAHGRRHIVPADPARGGQASGAMSLAGGCWGAAGERAGGAAAPRRPVGPSPAGAGHPHALLVALLELGRDLGHRPALAPDVGRPGRRARRHHGRPERRAISAGLLPMLLPVRADEGAKPPPLSRGAPSEIPGGCSGVLAVPRGCTASARSAPGGQRAALDGAGGSGSALAAARGARGVCQCLSLLLPRATRAMCCACLEERGFARGISLLGRPRRAAPPSLSRAVHATPAAARPRAPIVAPPSRGPCTKHARSSSRDGRVHGS
jgi:hypothetical protein